MIRFGTAVAFATAGVIALSGCSSGTHRSAGEASSGAAHPLSSSGARPPTFLVVTSVRIGPYVQEFGTPLPRNPAVAKVIASFRAAQDVWTESLVGGHPARLIHEYLTGVAYRRFHRALRGATRSGLEPSGTDVLFDTRVVALSGTAATVTTCDDDARVTADYRSTGHVQPASSVSASQAYVFEVWHLVPLAGHWAITTFSVALLPAEAAEKCQPGSVSA